MSRVSKPAASPKVTASPGDTSSPSGKTYFCTKAPCFHSSESSTDATPLLLTGPSAMPWFRNRPPGLVSLNASRKYAGN